MDKREHVTKIREPLNVQGGEELTYKSRQIRLIKVTAELMCL